MRRKTNSNNPLRSKDLLGKSLGGFVLEAVVGKGSSGVVYKATEESSGKLVALKILTSKWAADPLNLARFKREAISASSVNHPNVISVVDFGEVMHLFYLAMTFIEGRSLKAYMSRQGPLPMKSMARIGAEQASALDAIGRVGLIHRDVKPANIMIASSGGLSYLTDLGLAKAADNSQDVTLKGYTVGTPNYISPEQALAEEELTIAGDLYSLGATLYHAVTGELVFKRRNAILMMQAQVRDAPPDPREHVPELDSDFAELILEMLAKDPAARPSAADCAFRFWKLAGQEGRPPLPADVVERPRVEAQPSGALELVPEVPKATAGERGPRPKRSSGRPVGESIPSLLIPVILGLTALIIFAIAAILLLG